LDVDGVLNSAERPAWTDNVNGLYGIDPVLTERLARVLLATGAQVVVSSSWRIGGIAEGSLFRKAMVAADPSGVVLRSVIAATPISYEARRVRGDEIQEWLDENPDVTAFAIVDDNSDMAHLSDHLVLTTWAAGLTDELADELIQKLGGAEAAA
jgi:hypothetical protein